MTAPVASFQGGLADQPGRVSQATLGGVSPGGWPSAARWASARWCWPATSPGRSSSRISSGFSFRSRRPPSWPGEHGVRLALRVSSPRRVRQQSANRRRPGGRDRQPPPGHLLRRVPLLHRPQQARGFGLSVGRQPVSRPALRPGGRAARVCHRRRPRFCPATATIELAPLIARLREIDYRGYVSVELMNPQIWRIPPRQFGEIGLTALGKVVGPTRGLTRLFLSANRNFSCFRARGRIMTGGDTPFRRWPQGGPMRRFLVVLGRGLPRAGNLRSLPSSGPGGDFRSRLARDSLSAT